MPTIDQSKCIKEVFKNKDIDCHGNSHQMESTRWRKTEKIHLKKNNPPYHNIVWMPLFFVLSFMQGKNE